MSGLDDAAAGACASVCMRVCVGGCARVCVCIRCAVLQVGAVRLAQRLCGPKSKKEQEELDPAAAKPLR